jgi:hypothetical protein
VKLLAFLIAVLATSPPVLVAQGPGVNQEAGGGTNRRSSLEIIIPPTAFIARDAPTIVTHNPLAKKDAEALIRNGYPARLRYVAELWPASGLVGKATSTSRWETYVQYEPLRKVFEVVRETAPKEFQSLGSFSSFADVLRVLSRGYQPRLRAPFEPGRYYYSASLEVERMSANDLAAVRSWLGTPSDTADSPGRTILGFVAKVFTHLIGAEKERYRALSEVFEVKR